MRGQTVRTPEKVAQAIALRAENLTYREIGERLGISTKTACEWVTDPDASKRDRRKRGYVGKCIDCGGRTFSGNVTPPERCIRCWGHFRKVWTREEIIAAIQAWADETGGIPPAATDWNPGLAILTGHPEKAEKYYADQSWPACKTVQAEFGSWNAAITAAGFDARPPGRSGREGEDWDLCVEIAERYADGESSPALASDYGCSAYTIRYRIRKVGGTLRKPGVRAAVAA